MKVKIVSKSGFYPSYETEGSAGMDIRAFIDESITLKPRERKLVSTGLYVEIPRGYEGQIRARSGLAVKYGIGLANGVGTIDSDYRGEIKIALINLGNKDFTVNNGERIAQMIVAKHERVEWLPTDELSDSKRASGGFGHTGRE